MSSADRLPRVLRVVTLGSARGRYGGPFDTAQRQSLIASMSGFAVSFRTGFMRGDRPSFPDDDEVDYMVYPVWPLSRRLGVSGLVGVRLMRGLWRSVKGSDIVHVSAARELVPLQAALFALLRRRSLIVQPHGMLQQSERVGLRQVDRICRPIYRRAYLVIALTQTERTELELWFGGTRPPIVVIPNPVDPAVNQQASRPVRSSDRFEALFLARLHPRKRVCDFVEAARISSDGGSEIDWRVVGPDGGELGLVTSAHEELSSFVYEGALPQAAVADRLAKADVFVLPSEAEPFGNALVAAMALGIPVVVTESAALRSLVEQYGAGLIVRDADPAGIAAAVHRMAGDPGLVQRLSAGANRLVEAEFSVDRQARLLADAYTHPTRRAC